MPLYNPFSGSAFPPFVYNYSPLVLPNWRAALGKVKAGATIRNAKILMIGDSTTEGAYSNNSTIGDWVKLAPAALLAKMFNNIGISANNNSCFGFNGNDIAHDSRWVQGTGWIFDATPMLGGYAIHAGSGSTALTFLPNVNCDTFKCWLLKNTGLATIAVNINGGTNTTVNENTAASFTSQTITNALGANTLNVNWSSGTGNVYFGGVEAYNSAVASVNICNAGWDGSTSTSWNDSSSAWSPLNTIASFAPDLTIITLGINDWENSIPLATSQSNLQAIITAAKVVGDVILCSGVPSNPAQGVTTATQLTYVSMMQSLAASNGIIFMDIFNRWVNWTVSNNLGFYTTASAGVGNNLHPQGAGYADWADFLFSVISNP